MVLSEFFEEFESFKWRYFVIGFLSIFVIGAVWGGFYTVGEQEQAVITMFGKVLKVDGPGLHFKIPYLQGARVVDMTTSKMTIGYHNEKGRDVSTEDESLMITSDFNFCNIDFFLEYRVNSPIDYLYAASDPVIVMRNMALACIRNTVSQYPVDEVITTGKAKIQVEVKEALSELLHQYSIGLQVVNVTVQDAEPPTREIIEAFGDVETARQGKDTLINQAKMYKSEQEPMATAKADKILRDAEAVKQARIEEAQGQTSRFVSMFNEYMTNKVVTRKRLYYEMLEQIIPNLKVIITDGSTQPLLPLDKFQ